VSGADDDTERLWSRRLRWRMRGAWQWPAFALLTVVDAVIISVLPPAGEGLGLFPAFLLAGFFNLFAVAVAAPLTGLLLRRRRPSLPKVVADDRAGTVMLLLVTLVLVAAGVAHHPSVRDAQDDFARQQAAVRRYVHTQAPAQYLRHLAQMDTWKQGPDLYRTCVPGDDPRRHLCLIVDTSGSNVGLRRDPDQQPNARVAGADNPGRQDP
jgi:hypothetical protein